MHRSKKKRNIIIFSLVGVLLCMVVGYAAFQTRLEIKGTSKVTSNWNILITNVTDGEASGSAENATKPSWKDTSASMEANLYDKGDAMEYDVTIENKGTIDAKLNDILTNLQNSNSDAVIITFSGYTKGEVLQAGGSKLIHVKIEYNPEYEGGETSSEVTIDFEYTQDNKSEDIPDTYLLTYDYRTNGGERVDSEGEYLTSGSNVDLSNVAYKQGWRFVGWNTDKDAEVGMTSYQMKEEATTLYAIYSKDLTVTYEKGENVESISKNEDACTIYNNETSCEVTLPTITPSTGYAVDGWYNGNDKAGDPEDKYSLTNNITLTSKVSQNTYTVTYDYKTNGGTSTTKESDKVNYGENIDLTPTATKEGWTFIGWNTNKDATTGLSSLKMEDSNVTLYAIYRKEARTITITFNKNGATSQTPNGGSANSNDTLTQSCTIPAVYNNATQATTCNITSPTINASSNTPTVVGYNTSASATSSSWNHKTSKAVSSNATYYAITRKDAKTITVTFNKNNASSIGATSRSCTIAATYNGTAQGTTCNITSPTITASSGFSVLGWNTSSGSTSSAWTQNTAKSFSSNATYYAITRSSSQYTATFNANGATIGSASQSCYRYNGGSSCNIITPSITRSGFTITGWGTSASAASAAVKVNTSVAISSNITYYAVTSKKVTVTYNKGSNVSSIGSTSGTCTIQNSATNCQVILPTITPSTGYSSVGWSTTNGATIGTTAGSKITLSSNATYYANAIDNLPPTCTLKVTGATIDTVTVEATCQDPSGISKYEYAMNNSGYNDNKTTKTYTFDSFDLSTVKLRATDGVGNNAEFKLDTSALEEGYDIIYDVLEKKYQELSGDEEDFQNSFLNKTYPVGSIYISTSSTNPSSLFGGTWTSYGAGRTLVGVGSNGETNYTSAGLTGGNEKISLAVANLPAHTHSVTPSGTVSSTFKGTSATLGSAGSHTHSMPYTATRDSNENTQGGAGAVLPGVGFADRLYVIGYTLTTTSAGAHTHTFTAKGSVTSSFAGTNVNTTSVGSSSSLDVRNPYITTYMWKRTA